MTAAVVILGITVALLSMLVVGLLRSHAEVLRRLHELGAGVYGDDQPVTVATDRPVIRTGPDVAGPRPADGSASAVYDVVGASPGGDAVAVGVAGAPHLTLLAFLTSGCTTCAGFWRAFAGGAADELARRGTRLVIVTRGAEQESPAEVDRLAPAGVLTVMSTAAFDDYGVPVNPYFILVDGADERIVGEGAAATWPQVAELLLRAEADRDVLGETDFEDYDDDGADGVDVIAEPVATEPPPDPHPELVIDLDAPEHAVPTTRPAPLPVRPAAAERERDRGPEPRRTAGLDSRQRDALAEAELFVAGIGPGHPSLYPTSLTDESIEDR